MAGKDPEAPPPWVIEEERRKRERREEQPQLPLDEPEPPPGYGEPDRKPDDGDKRGVVIIGPDGDESTGAYSGATILRMC